MSRGGPSLFPTDVLEFFKGVSRLAARAKARGNLGPDGHPIWSEDELRAFCKGARAYRHLSFYGNALVRSVQEIEACLEDGYDASDIHNILAGYAPANA